jgi:hypothetical protein
MIEDRELDAWREEWNAVAESGSGLPHDFQRMVRQRIARQERLFVWGNVLTGIVFLGMLIFAWYLTQQARWIGTGWATGVCVLVFAAIGIRIWILRQTWRPEAQSTRAFVELWRARAAARIRLLRASIRLSIGWLILCAALTVANWGSIEPDVKAHPQEWLALLAVCVIMQPVLWFGASWLRRRKLAELNQVETILTQMKN